jgi:hypothetical protein
MSENTDINNRMNQGYIITDSIHIGDTEYVLGVNSRAPARYVTWACKGGNNYYWGNYHTDLLTAQKDLLDRADSAIEFQMNRQARAALAPKRLSRECERS